MAKSKGFFHDPSRPSRPRPLWCSMVLSKLMAAATSFVVIFFLWCLHFIALQLEAPFGDEPNDLPMDQMILDWNNSRAPQCPRSLERS